MTFLWLHKTLFIIGDKDLNDFWFFNFGHQKLFGQRFQEPIRNTLLSWLFCVWRVCSVGQMGLHWFGYSIAAGLGLREFVGWYGGLSFTVAAIGRFG